MATSAPSTSALVIDRAMTRNSRAAKRRSAHTLVESSGLFPRRPRRAAPQVVRAPEPELVLGLPLTHPFVAALRGVLDRWFDLELSSLTLDGWATVVEAPAPGVDFTLAIYVDDGLGEAMDGEIVVFNGFPVEGSAQVTVPLTKVASSNFRQAAIYIANAVGDDKDLFLDIQAGMSSHLGRIMWCEPVRKTGEVA
jgi:hypothetical protein